MPKAQPKTKAKPLKQHRRAPSRMAKAGLLKRIREDTKAAMSGSLLTTLRRQGYEEIPLDELQDRLSKLRTPLAELILSERG